MVRKGENIYKRKDGRWEGRYISGRNDNGRVKYSSVYAKTYEEVKQKLHEAGSMADKEHSANKCSLSDFTDEWLGYMKPRIKESTYVKYYNVVNRHICPDLGSLSLSQLTSKEISIYADTLLVSGGKEGQRLSGKTVSDIISVLKSILHFIETRYSCQCFSIERLHLPKESKKMQIFTTEEQIRLTNYLKNSNERRDMGILIALYTGLRIGEICALKEKNICISTSSISVSKTVQRIQNPDNIGNSKTKLIVDTPKSLCSIRDVPVPSFLIQQLIPCIQSPENFFLSGSEKNMIEPRNLEYYFKKVLKNAGVRDTNFHSCRHSFATRCVEQGFDIKSLSEILGHSSVDITLNKYVHPSMKMKRENMEKLSVLFDVK